MNDAQIGNTGEVPHVAGADGVVQLQRTGADDKIA